MTRGQKKFTYGLFYLLLLILAVWALWPSSGAPVTPVCSGPSCGTNQPLPLRVSATPEIFRSGSTNRIAVLGQVTNPNADYGASRFSYNFKIFDRSGKTIADIPGSGTIYPSETRYVLANYDTGSIDPNLLSDRPGLEIKDSVMAPAGNFIKPDVFLASQPSIRFGQSGIVVSGTAKNRNSFPTGGIGVVVMLENRYGDALFASQTVIQPIGGSKEAPFEVSFPRDQGISQSLDIQKTQVFFFAQ